MARTPKRAAREILKQFGNTFPVDVQAIVEAHRVKLISAPLEEPVSSWLFQESGRAIIRVNKNLRPERRRFSIAHSFGHFILHRGTPEFKIFVEATEPVKESGRSMTGSRLQEEMADDFASELLMPEGVLKEEIRGFHVSAHDAKTVRRLATKFGVSEQMLTMRLAKLGLIRV